MIESMDNPEAFSRFASSVSIIMLPTNLIFSSGVPSLRRFSDEMMSGVRSRSERRSVTRRFISSSRPSPRLSSAEASAKDDSDTLSYALLTLHRPSNVDKKEVFEPIISFLTEEVAGDMPLLWPIHPRARKRLEEFGLWEKVVNNKNMILLHPLGYHDMLRLNMSAKVVLTDSGGLQEECTVLGTPCLTLRWNTERPVTLREYGGASVLVGNNVKRIREEYNNTLKLKRKPDRPELWDGKTAGRCVEEIIRFGIE